jgi:alpha-tubulin suppressor-like RCC1 family protein
VKAAAEPARRRRLFTLAALAIALLAPAGAQAYWTSSGSGSSSGNAGTLAAPTNVIGTPGAGTVTLSWSAVSPPGGSGTVSYYVTRDGGNAAGCPTATAPTTVTSCTDSGLAPGIHSYTVTAVWNSWTATSSVTQVTVVIGAPSKLAFTQSPGNTAAGVAFTLQPKVTVQDQSGNPVTTDTSSVTLAITTPAGATLTCTANPKAALAGVATFAGCAITKAGSYTLTATDGSLTSAVSGSFTISATTASKLSFTQSPGNTTAGATFTLQPQVTVQDQYGNTVTTDTSSVTLAITTPAGATLTCTANPKAASAGVASFAGCAITKAGSYTLTSTDGSLTSAVSGSFTISAGAPVSFTVTNPGTRTAGTTFTVTLTASNDAYGNAPTSYAGTQCIAFSGPTASPNGTTPLYPQGSCPVGQSAVTFNASGVGILAGVTLYDATTSTTLTATDMVNGTTGTSGAFTVNGLATMGSLVLTAATTTPTAGAADNLTISAGDTWGNLITTYTGQRNLTFSGAGMAGTVHPTVSNRTGTAVNFGTAESITFTNGVATVTGTSNGVMRLYRAGTAQIVVTDGTYNNGGGLTVTVGPAAASGLALSAAQAVVTPGEANNLTVRAIDAYGNTAPSYTGTHNLTFSGASVNGAQNPTVTNSSGTVVNFGTTTAITFANGVSTVSGSSNGVMRLYKIETAHLVVTDGTYTSASFSVIVSNVTASSVIAGGFHTCALVNGTVECWGLNDSGQLGNGSTTNSSTPVIVSGLSNVTQIAPGKYHTCALRSDGTVWCWGDNTYGQLGNNSTTDSHTPVEVRGVGGTGYLTGVVEVAADGNFSCARLTDGTVRCWGRNQSGQLGTGVTDNNAHSTPLQVIGVGGSGTLGSVTAITAGANHTCALISGGTVDCWGLNDHGQLGNNSTTDNDTPVRVVGAGGTGYLTGVTAVSGGRMHVCVLLSGGSVYCWGDNENGELGDGTTTNRSVPVRAGSISTAVSVSAGEYHSCALLADGTAQCWGASAYGQVGDGTTADTSTPVTVIGPGGYGVLSGIAAISAGGGDITETDDYEHTCALTTDGTVVCWGQNNYGQLGNGTTTMSISPIGVALQ